MAELLHQAHGAELSQQQDPVHVCLPFLPYSCLCELFQHQLTQHCVLGMSVRLHAPQSAVARLLLWVLSCQNFAAQKMLVQQYCVGNAFLPDCCRHISVLLYQLPQKPE